MIPYHGGPMPGDEAAAERIGYAVWKGRHAFVSHEYPKQIELAAGISQSFALDNGAFSAWRKGRPIEDFAEVYDWYGTWLKHPACDFAVIPDVIGGSEADQDALLREWPFGFQGVPVWHLNESIDRLVRLADDWPRIALGSCAEYDVKRPAACIARLAEALEPISEDGTPLVKLHGLRMLNPAITTAVPLSSADSTNAAMNCKYDTAWRGTYAPATREMRAAVIVDRIESHLTPARMEVGRVATLFDDLDGPLWEEIA